MDVFSDRLVCEPPVLIFAQTLHSLTFGTSMRLPSRRSIIGSRERAARGQAFYSSVAFGAGGLLGGLVSGWSWDRLGGAMALSVRRCFALVGLVFVVE